MQPLWLISLYGTDPLWAKVLLGNLTLSYFFFFSFYHISIVQIFLYIRISWASFLKMLMSGHIPRPIKSQSQPMDRGLSLFFFFKLRSQVWGPVLWPIYSFTQRWLFHPHSLCYSSNMPSTTLLHDSLFWDALSPGVCMVGIFISSSFCCKCLLAIDISEFFHIKQDFSTQPSHFLSPLSYCVLLLSISHYLTYWH